MYCIYNTLSLRASQEKFALSANLKIRCFLCGKWIFNSQNKKEYNKSNGLLLKSVAFYVLFSALCDYYGLQRPQGE